MINMALEEVVIQTADEVSTIDYRRNTNEMIASQSEEIQNTVETISEQLNNIVENTSTTISSDGVDLTQVTDMIENIDTAVVEANTQDILIKVNEQQQQIDDIHTKLDLILSKL